VYNLENADPKRGWQGKGGKERKPPLVEDSGTNQKTKTAKK